MDTENTTKSWKTFSQKTVWILWRSQWLEQDGGSFEGDVGAKLLMGNSAVMAHGRPWYRGNYWKINLIIFRRSTKQFYFSINKFINRRSEDAPLGVVCCDGNGDIHPALFLDPVEKLIKITFNTISGKVGNIFKTNQGDVKNIFTNVFTHLSWI